MVLVGQTCPEVGISPARWSKVKSQVLPALSMCQHCEGSRGGKCELGLATSCPGEGPYPGSQQRQYSAPVKIHTRMSEYPHKHGELEETVNIDMDLEDDDKKKKHIGGKEIDKYDGEHRNGPRE